MMVIPAIDIMGGKCVRLVKGKKKEVILYEKNPVDIAEGYIQGGAKLIHVVDLDGAFTGRMKNLRTIKNLAERFPIQVGGGVRSEERIEQLLSSGVKRVVVSTILFGDRDYSRYLRKKYGKSLIGSFDFRGEKLAYEGWLKRTNIPFEVVSLDFEEIIVTCSDRDGTLSGPDINLLMDIRTKFDGRIVAAGGVRDINDLKEVEDAGIDGVIIGRAILEERIRFEEFGF
ncbi:MAG: 1-(5-phosphoribosyl)-5-[(5-phosphoribosylamino)methylideneamino] imidazole-4-carboxamide isomerase [Candidatus Micrarchaeota archaeon]